jgi:hypothetical protein
LGQRAIPDAAGGRWRKKEALLLNGTGMNIRGARFASACACMCWAAMAVAGCQVGAGEEITSKKPYADVIGATYRVEGDNLYAYGVYESLNDRKVTFIELVPENIAGPEIAFRRKILKGQIIRILSAWHHFMLFDNGVYYLAAVENSDLPEGIPIRLGLSRGNQGVGADLNPVIYKRVAKGP